MGDAREWQKGLLGAALAAAVRTAVEYASNPDARDGAMEDVKSRLAQVDYNAVARALSKAIDQFADNSKSAINEAIDSLRESADEAVEAAADRAQAQLGRHKRGRGKLFFGLLLGLALGFILLNEDRRNQIMDRLTGATGPIDTSDWAPISPASVSGTASTVGNAIEDPAPEVAEPVAAVQEEASKPAEENPKTAKQETEKVKPAAEDTVRSTPKAEERKPA